MKMEESRDGELVPKNSYGEYDKEWVRRSKTGAWFQKHPDGEWAYKKPKCSRFVKKDPVT